jgi:Uma2 family endonuclease
MTQAKVRFNSFEEYLTWSDDPENNDPENAIERRYELIAGELMQLPPESPEHNFIANHLQFLLVALNVVSLRLVRIHSLELQVPVLQLKDAANRYPDLVVLRPEHLDLMGRRLTITLDMPPPRLVAEVVGPGKSNYDRDFINKRAQYAAIDVPEYWQIDPQTRSVMVLELRENDYQEVGTFEGDDAIVSPIFPELNLTVAQILDAD